MTFLALATDLNLNYMLHPLPVMQPFGDDYRLWSILGLNLAFVFARSFGLVVEYVVGWFRKEKAE